jgi:primosomal replication protein N
LIDRAALNHVELTACIAEAQPLRYTPAGIPAANFVLEHESERLESGTIRKVKLTIRAVSFGPLSEQLSRLALGKPFLFSGFLINVRAGKGVLFHIQGFGQAAESTS